MSRCVKEKDLTGQQPGQGRRGKFKEAPNWHKPDSEGASLESAPGAFPGSLSALSSQPGLGGFRP